MGLRLRLKASFDHDARSAAPTRVVLVAMQQYGLILADNGSDWYLSGDSDDAWTPMMDSLVSGTSARCTAATSRRSTPDRFRPRGCKLNRACSSCPVASSALGSAGAKSHPCRGRGVRGPCFHRSLPCQWPLPRGQPARLRARRSERHRAPHDLRGAALERQRRHLAVPLRERARAADRPGRRPFDRAHGRRLDARRRPRPAGVPQRGARAQRLARSRVQLELHRRRADPPERGRRRRARRHAERRGRDHGDLRAERLGRLHIVLAGLPDHGQRQDVGPRRHAHRPHGDPHDDRRRQERSQSHLRLGHARLRLRPHRVALRLERRGQHMDREAHPPVRIRPRSSRSTSARSIRPTPTASTFARTAF